VRAAIIASFLLLSAVTLAPTVLLWEDIERPLRFLFQEDNEVAVFTPLTSGATEVMKRFGAQRDEQCVGIWCPSKDLSVKYSTNRTVTVLQRTSHTRDDLT
jgi:hypothetical protein